MHRNLPYLQQVANHCDKLVVMMYDTALPWEKFYIALMQDWTRELAETIAPTRCELILGIPAYEDAGVGYHRPEVENISSALKGISATMPQDAIHGIALYCEWEMDAAKWQQWRRFMNHQY